MSDKPPIFGNLREIPMREIWSNEAQKFTPWLQDNINVLGEALELDLYAKERERPVGDFSLDLFAETKDGQKVAIENQFNRTDHTHLGQLLTYAAGCDADIVIWVVEETRDEHQAAMEWLNRKTDTETEFYLVKVEIIKIDESRPICKFIPVTTPNNWQKKQHQKTLAPTLGDSKRENCFRQFAQNLEVGDFSSYPPRQRMKKRHGYLCGVRRWSYMHDIGVKDGYARVYLEFSYAGRKENCIKLHDQLKIRKEAIDAKLKLDWGDNKWGQEEIGISREGSFDDSEETLVEIRAWAVENIIKLAAAVPPKMLQEIADAVGEEESEAE